jgi:hypothetical protein
MAIAMLPYCTVVSISATSLMPCARLASNVKRTFPYMFRQIVFYMHCTLLRRFSQVSAAVMCVALQVSTNAWGCAGCMAKPTLRRWIAA